MGLLAPKKNLDHIRHVGSARQYVNTREELVERLVLIDDFGYGLVADSS